MKLPVCEVLTWKATENASDESMQAAMEDLSKDVQKLPGFLQQTLYKSASNDWVCIYYWESEQQAHDSNAAVAETPSFKKIMALIAVNSVTMEVMSSRQSSGQPLFT